jgi:hypothetical protein
MAAILLDWLAHPTKIVAELFQKSKAADAGERQPAREMVSGRK